MTGWDMSASLLRANRIGRWQRNRQRTTLVLRNLNNLSGSYASPFLRRRISSTFIDHNAAAEPDAGVLACSDDEGGVGRVEKTHPWDSLSPTCVMKHLTPDGKGN